MNDRDLKGNFSVNILLNSKKVKKTHKKIYLSKLHDALKKFNKYDVSFEDFRKKIDEQFKA